MASKSTNQSGCITAAEQIQGIYNSKQKVSRYHQKTKWWSYLFTHTRLTALFSGTTRVSRYQKGKTSLDFTEAVSDSEWQWHQLGHMQVCTSLQTDNDASTSSLKFFNRADALPATQPTASKHWRHKHIYSTNSKSPCIQIFLTVQQIFQNLTL